jgi:hypothetical protein
MGLGGGIKLDTRGTRPGSDEGSQSNSGGVGLGLFGDAGFNAGPLNAALQNSIG